MANELKKEEAGKKVVLNDCYGGFGISKEALLWLIRKKSPLVNSEQYSPVDTDKLKPWKPANGEGGWQADYYGSLVKDNIKYSVDRDVDRSHPDLVAVVEALGNAASGDSSKLKIEIVPESWGDHWSISEYDGLESLDRTPIADAEFVSSEDLSGVEEQMKARERGLAKKSTHDINVFEVFNKKPIKKEAVKMTNELNIGDILPPKKDGPEKFVTSDQAVPEFIKKAAYSPEETMEETIQRDWQRLVEGLSDYVLAEQLTERELVGMGKPVSENYAEYFHTTLKEVQKNRKKAEQKLFKMIPRHSQLEACDFFFAVQEQNEKEKEARERAMEEYPPAGVEKLERGDNARKGLKKEAAEMWMAPEAQPGSQTNQENTTCSACNSPLPAKMGVVIADKAFCQKCHDLGHSVPESAASPAKPSPESLPPAGTSTEPGYPGLKKDAGCEVCEDAGAPIVVEISDVEVKDKGKISVKPNHPETVKDMLDTVKDKEEEVLDVHLTKEAAARWKPGQNLRAKHNGADACVVYVNEDDKTYIVKVCGTMYPSYYSYQDAYDTFDAVKPEETKDAPEAKERGLS